MKQHKCVMIKQYNHPPALQEQIWGQTATFVIQREQMQCLKTERDVTM